MSLSISFWMVDMEKREKLVVGLTRRGMTRSGSSSSPTGADRIRNESEGGDHSLTLGKKKGKVKTLKWRVSDTDMNSKREACGSDGDHDDTVLSSVTTASFSSLISRKRVKTLGKVAVDCAAVDPPVPRKLRSARNKLAGQTVSTSTRHVKKKRHLSALGTRTFLMDRETRRDEISTTITGWNLLTAVLGSGKQLKVQFDGSTIYPAKPEAPRCLVNSKKPDLLEHDRNNVKNNTAQGTRMIL
ncbi:hypothetical protein ABZP36_020425 [Zizania latifolia]